MQAGNPAYGDFESIATVVLSGNQTNIDFTSIPPIYTHLQIRGLILNGSAATNTSIRVGNTSIDTGTNYSRHFFGGQGAAVIQGNATTVSSGFIHESTQPSSLYPLVFVVDLIDYKDTNKFKTIRSFSGMEGNATGTATDWRVYLTSSLWRSTSAITDIRIFNTTGTLGNLSHVALYGIKG